MASARLDGTEAVAESNNAAIEIRRFVFVSPQAELSGYDDLRIVNADGVAHEIVADDGSFETGRIEPGDSATVQTPNGITFHCVIHPNMTGQT